MSKNQVNNWQNSIIFFYASIAILLVFISFFSYKSFKSLIEKESLVNHTNQIIYTSKEVLLALNDAEASQRGFIITSDSLYLKSYQKNLQLARLYQNSLASLTQDNPLQQEQIKILQERTSDKIHSMNRSIVWKNNNKLPELRKHFQAGDGRQRMDEVKESLENIVAEEERLLSQRSKELDQSRQFTLSVIYVITITAFLVMILLYYLFRQHLRVKDAYEFSIHKKNTELAATNEELQASLEEISAGNEHLTELNNELTHSQKLLTQLNEQLEEIVKDRTAELTEANRKLRIEIAEKELAEDALHKTKNLYQDLYDNAPDIYLSINVKDARIISCNQTMLNKLGYTKDEVIGLPVFELSDPDTIDLTKKAFQRLKATGVVQNAPLKIKAKDGKALDVLLNSTAIRNEAGEIVGTRSCWQDITELKKAQDELREREEHYRLITENASDMISKHAIDGTYTYASPISMPLLGYKPEDLIGQSAYDFFHPEDIAAVQQLISPEKELPDQLQFSYRKRRKNGEYVWYETTSKALRKENGEVRELLCVSRDISERKKAEEHLQNYAHKLEAANKELESFSYSVSHDLRAPLRAIIGYSKILLNDFENNLGEEGKEIAGYIIKNTSKMGVLIDDLLAFSRLGRQEKKETDFSMDLLLDDVVNEIKAANRERKINFHITPLPNSKGDPALIRHVVSNLLSNAVKFTSHKSPAEISISSFVKDGEVVYKFQDNGAGFNMKYVGKIFDVFQRLHSEAEFPGTGIGLALAQKIIHKHGGRIWAEGEVDKGATFYFTLPKNY